MTTHQANMPDPPAPLRWGILSTGRIAGVFARGLATSEYGRLQAVGSRTMENAARFAITHGIDPAHAHGSCDALLADPTIEAIYIATPHPLHAEWTVKAAAAGKHILCEKPAGMNHAEGLRMIETARHFDVLFMEAFMYRCHPQTEAVIRLIRQGVIGEVKLIQAAFGFRNDFNPASRLWNHSLGGGAILDVGCYAMSFARLAAGAAIGEAFDDPVEITGSGQLHAVSGVDEAAVASLRFASGVVAQIATCVSATIDNTARIFGTDGWIEVPHPWIITKSGGEQHFHIHRRGEMSPETITTEAGDLYALEADAFATALRAALRHVPAMTPEDTLGNLAALDRWRQTVGLRYPADS
jgi:predicted dehydrogenase